MQVAITWWWEDGDYDDLRESCLETKYELEDDSKTDNTEVNWIKLVQVMDSFGVDDEIW